MARGISRYVDSKKVPGKDFLKQEETIMRQTTMAKEATIERKWYVIDATGLTLGRLATQVATILRGKHKPTYTPHVDTGDYVIVINAEKVTMTGKKLDRTMYYRHTGWLGHLKQRTARQFQEADPTGFVFLHPFGGTQNFTITVLINCNSH